MNAALALFPFFAPVPVLGASSIETADRLGDLFPAQADEVVALEFARSVARLERAPELLLDALATGFVTREEGDRIAVRAPSRTLSAVR